MDQALVIKGAEAPKLCLSPVEMRAPIAADGLLPAGTASTVIRTIFSPTYLLRNFCPAEEMNFNTTTSVQTYATYSGFWQRKS